jgi:hypothetical protein
MNFTIAFISAYFNMPNWFHRYPKLYVNIVQYFAPVRVIGFLEVYE